MWGIALGALIGLIIGNILMRIDIGGKSLGKNQPDMILMGTYSGAVFGGFVGMLIGGAVTIFR